MIAERGLSSVDAGTLAVAAPLQRIRAALFTSATCATQTAWIFGPSRHKLVAPPLALMSFTTHVHLSLWADDHRTTQTMTTSNSIRLIQQNRVTLQCHNHRHRATRTRKTDYVSKNIEVPFISDPVLCYTYSSYQAYYFGWNRVAPGRVGHTVNSKIIVTGEDSSLTLDRSLHGMALIPSLLPLIRHLEF